MNILLTNMDLKREQIVTDPLTGATGYGIEYTYDDGSNALIYINGTLTASRTGITGGYNLTQDTSPLRFGNVNSSSVKFAIFQTP